MPQMKPMNWFYFFFTFSFIILLFNVTNYFITINKNTLMMQNKKNNKKINFNWKW